MKKIIICLVILPVLFTASIINTNANEVSKENEVEEIRKNISMYVDYDEIIYPGDVLINGKTQYLYCEFENNNDALENFKLRYDDILNKVMQQYNLDQMTEVNWEDYREKIVQYIKDISIYDNNGNQIIDNEEEFSEIDKFFDIFENKYENNFIKLKVSSANLRRAVVDDTEMALLLPNYSPMVEDFVENNLRIQETLKKKESMQRINNNGVSYASKWATMDNTSYQGFGKDCTNFASQILVASGVSMVNTGKESTGWWYTRNGSWVGANWITTHKYSISWVNANTFARYMGVGYKTNNHYNFSANIKKYDFIAYDKGSDGGWDHIGYVTADDTYVGSYGYYDYKVAQHTTNYHAWTSSSINKWETLQNQGYTYGRVRR